MTTTEAKPKLELDASKRDWLKTMGAAIGIRVGEGPLAAPPVVLSITAKPVPTQPSTPVAPPGTPAQPNLKPRTVIVTVTDKMTKTPIPNADVSVGVQRG